MREKFVLKDLKNGINKENLINSIYKVLTKDVVVVCIGTDKCIGDAVGPMVGSILERKGLPFSSYGTLHEPIHALNLEKRLDVINKKHKGNTMLAIDACLGDSNSIGEICLRDFPIHPGKGVGKKLMNVGDYSIIGIVDSADSAELFTSRSIRLSFVLDMAEMISDCVVEAYARKYGYNNKEVAVNGYE